MAPETPPVTSEESLFLQDPSVFRTIVNSRLSHAIPDLTPVSDSSGGSIAFFQASKPLADLLGSSGNPISCPFCAVPLARGPSARLCLTCGKTLGPLPRGTDGSWRGSMAERRLIMSLSLEGDKDGEKRAALLNAMVRPPPSTEFAEPGPDLSSFLPQTPAPIERVAPMLETPTFMAHPSPLHMFSHEPPSSNNSPNNNPFPSRARRSSSGGQDFFSQLETLDSINSSGVSPSPPPLTRHDSAPLAVQSTATPTPPELALNPDVKAALDSMVDMSFMLHDRLILPHKAKVVSRNGSSQELAFQPPANNNEEDDDAEWGDFET